LPLSIELLIKTRPIMLKQTGHKRRVRYSYRAALPWAVDALERDNYQCQHCHSDTLDVLVHHLDESRRNGFKSMNNELSNLITLCRSCHAKIHKQNVVQIKYEDKMVRMRLEGKKLKEIAGELNITPQRVSQLLQRFYARQA